MDFLQHFLPGDPLEENSQRSIGIQSALHSTGNEKIEFIAGLDAEFTRGELSQAQDEPTRGSAFLRETVPSGKHYDYSVDAVTIAPFVQLAWKLADRWELFAGLRYEYTDYNYDNLMITGRTREDGTACGFGGCRYSRPADRSDTFDNLSPKLELHYTYHDNHLAYLNLSSGFRAPQATELYRLQRDQVVADLESEDVRSIGLGFKGTTASLNYDLAFYYMEKDNVIFRDSDFFNVDSGATDHAGAELAITWSMSEQIYLGVTANYARHEYSNDQFSSGMNINGNDVDTAPRYFGNMRLGWTPTPSTRLELEWIHMGSYYLEPENLRKYEGHEVFNLRAGMEFGDGWRASARVMNLADERYAERADFTGFTQERYFPAEPRSLYLGIEKRFAE
jgi:outer membrane receptor protein involved in Fe transport